MKNNHHEPFHADLLWNDPLDRQAVAIIHAYRGSTTPRRILTSEHFRISYPGTVNERDVEYVVKVIESGRNDLIRRVAAAGILFQFPPLEIFINETTGNFVGRTGQPPWSAAATRGNRVELQPLKLLKRRRILETTIRHELTHVVTDAIGRGHIPRWLSEGLAIHIAGEGQKVSRYQTKEHASTDELEKAFTGVSSAEEMRAAYAAAYREVMRLVSSAGETAVWRRVRENN